MNSPQESGIYISRRTLLRGAGATAILAGGGFLGYLYARSTPQSVDTGLPNNSPSLTPAVRQAKIEAINDSDKKTIAEISKNFAQAIADGNYALALTFTDQTIPGIEAKLRAYKCPSGTKVDRLGEIELVERVNAVSAYAIWDSDKCKISGVTETNYVGLVFRNPKGKWQVQDFYK